MKYRKKPVVIEAMQFNGENSREIRTWMKDGEPEGWENESIMRIETLEGTMSANKSDWVIKGINGEFYPCKPDIFEKTYDPAE